MGPASVAFFLSGFAALIYQIAWQRLLVLPIGADVYSTTVTVAAFMAGLGCGSLVGGRVADRLTRRQSIALFIAAELTIAAFGMVSQSLYYDWMYFNLGGRDLPAGTLAGVVFLSLLLPTVCMGMSLPLLARALVRSLDTAPRRVGLLYGLNTLGAAAGAFVTTWIFFPVFGLAGSIRIAAGLNALAVVAASRLWRGSAPSEQPIGTPPADRLPDPENGEFVWAFRTWTVLYGIAGFQALSLEIVWFRLLGVMVKSSAFTFGTLLTVYLSGIGAGAAAASLFLKHIRRPGRAFLFLQAFVGLYGGISIFALAKLLPVVHILSPWWEYFGSYEPLDAVRALRAFWARGPETTRFVQLYGILPAFLVGPPTVAMGASFALLQKVTLVHPERIGKRVAAVLIANIAGSTLGCLFTGWLALTYLGSALSLKVLAAISLVFLLLGIHHGSRKRFWTGSAGGLATAAAAFVLFSLPDNLHLWERLHGVTQQRIVLGEDASGVFTLRASGQGAAVLINGIRQSWIPYGNIHTVLGALPAFIHPAPRDAALIGLGSGDTLFALAGRRELTNIASIEIVRPQLAALGEWRKTSGYFGLDAILSDPRIHHLTGDGRAYIMRSRRRFDVIEADALRPTSAFSGNLYSTGYFTLLLTHLRPGGFAVTWSPTTRVQDTFTAVFPYTLSFGDILIGSAEPIAFEPQAIAHRLQEPAVRAYYEKAGIAIDALLAPYLTRVPVLIHGTSRVSADLNEDLFPRDEFAVPRVRQ